MPAGRRGPAFLVSDNFYVLKAYNESDVYALTIGMVGDRLSTDIAFGTRNGILAILVLTGEATLADVERGPVKPDINLPHAKEILKYL